MNDNDLKDEAERVCGGAVDLATLLLRLGCRNVRVIADEGTRAQVGFELTDEDYGIKFIEARIRDWSRHAMYTPVTLARRPPNGWIQHIAQDRI